MAREALEPTLLQKLLSVHKQEVEVRREGTQKIQDIVASIISNDALALDGGAKLHRFVFLVQNAVPLYLKFTPICI